MGGNTTESMSEMSGHHPGQADGQRQDMSVEDEVIMTESLFGIMGEYGNNIMIYSSDSIILKHQISVGHIVRSFQFTKNNRELIVVTKD